jgi:hypothetical protein
MNLLWSRVMAKHPALVTVRSSKKRSKFPQVVPSVSKVTVDKLNIDELGFVPVSKKFYLLLHPQRFGKEIF